MGTTRMNRSLFLLCIVAAAWLVLLPDVSKYASVLAKTPRGRKKGDHNRNPPTPPSSSSSTEQVEEENNSDDKSLTESEETNQDGNLPSAESPQQKNLRRHKEKTEEDTKKLTKTQKNLRRHKKKKLTSSPSVDSPSTVTDPPTFLDTPPFIDLPTPSENNDTDGNNDESENKENNEKKDEPTVEENNNDDSSETSTPTPPPKATEPEQVTDGTDVKKEEEENNSSSIEGQMMKDDVKGTPEEEEEEEDEDEKNDNNSVDESSSANEEEEARTTESPSLEDSSSVPASLRSASPSATEIMPAPFFSRFHSALSASPAHGAGGGRIPHFSNALPYGHPLTSRHPHFSSIEGGSHASCAHWTAFDVVHMIASQTKERIAEDEAALENLVYFADKRLATLTEEGRSIPPYFIVPNSPCVLPVDSESPYSVCTAFSPCADLTEKQVYKNVKSGMAHTRQSPNSEANFYMPVWNASNIFDTSIDCAVHDCILTLQRITDNEIVVIRFDADGRHIGSPPSLSKETKEDAIRAQHVFKTIKYADEIVKIYNKKAKEMVENELEKPLCPPEMVLVLELIKYKTDAVTPYWLWNYNVRAYIQTSMVTMVPQHGVSNAVSAYTGDTAFQKPLEVFDWTESDEERGDVGMKPVFVTALWQNARDPMSMHYSDAHAVIMEGVFRSHVTLSRLEKLIGDQSASVSDYMTVQEVLKTSHPSTADNRGVALTEAYFTSANLPVLIQVLKKNPLQ